MLWESGASTREKVLDTTRRLISGAPLSEITSRRIATEAGVNVASINYHFHTEDRLCPVLGAADLNAGGYPYVIAPIPTVDNVGVPLAISPLPIRGLRVASPARRIYR